jgi:hypothetical protein
MHDGPIGETVFEARQRHAAAGNRASALESDLARLRAENADLRGAIDGLIRWYDAAPERIEKRRMALEVDHARFVLARHGSEAPHPQLILSFAEIGGTFAAAIAAPGANFKTKKALMEAVRASTVPDADRGGDRGFAGIGCYQLGPLGPVEDGEYRCEGQRYPEPRRWRAVVVVQSGRVVEVR